MIEERERETERRDREKGKIKRRDKLIFKQKQ
jgi:hypothetical protein